MASWGAGQRFRESLDRTPGSDVLLLHLDRESKQHDTLAHAMSMPASGSFAHVYTGPGDYDPSDAKGYKADPKSGFLTGDRFHELEKQG